MVELTADAGARIRVVTGVPAALLIADRRYAWAHEVADAAVTRETASRGPACWGATSASVWVPS